MSHEITSSTPRYIGLGTKDNSTRPLPPTPKSFAQYVPKFYGWASKGTSSKGVLCSATKLRLLFGDEVLDVNSKAATHVTPFLLNGLSQTQCVFERVIDPNITTKANVTLWAEVVDKQGDYTTYKRNSDGAKTTYLLKTDDNGVEVSWYTSSVAEDYNPNNASTKYGVTPSYGGGPRGGNIYPVATFIARDFGKGYENEGFSMEALLGAASDQLTLQQREGDDMHDSAMTYLFKRYTNVNGSRVAVNNILDEPFVKFAIGYKEIKDGLTGASLNLDNKVVSLWDDTETFTKYSDFDAPIMHQDSIKQLINKLIAAETRYTGGILGPNYANTNLVTWEDGLEAMSSEWFDFAIDDNQPSRMVNGQQSRINLLTGKSTMGVEYEYIRMVAGVASYKYTPVNVGSGTTIWLGGAAEEVWQDLTFEQAVTAKLDKYTDPDFFGNIVPLNKESFFIDSGYSLDIKKKMCQVLGNRADVGVALSTYIADSTKPTKKQDISEARAIGTILKNLLQLTPESAYFGTSVARAVVVVGSGMLADDSYSARLPLLYDLTHKLGKFAGALNGDFKSEYNFSHGLRSGISLLKDIDPDTITGGMKSKLWGSGMIYPEVRDIGDYYYPGTQTVYDDPTSVLNNLNVIVAICTITKLHHWVHGLMSGADNLTELAFIEETEKLMRLNLPSSKFGDTLKINNTCFITDGDRARGYSSEILTEIFANNMKTVIRGRIHANRMEDFGGN